jgi:chromosome segregation ATPase
MSGRSEMSSLAAPQPADDPFLISESEHIAVQVDASVDVLSKDERKAAAVRAIEALRAHGNAGIERNLDAAAAIAALKAGLLHGEFGPFCTETLQISSTYRARLLRLDDVKDHVREALAWAATQKHRLAECQSAQNLIKVVDDWLNKDRAPEPKSDSNKQERRRSKDIIAEKERVIQETAALVRERDKTISEREFEVASRDDEIADLRRRLSECEEEIATLRDPLPDEVREQALEALTSSRESAADELAAIAKRHHWRLKDLRRELENFTAVQVLGDA